MLGHRYAIGNGPIYPSVGTSRNGKKTMYAKNELLKSYFTKIKHGKTCCPLCLKSFANECALHCPNVNFIIK